MRLTRGAEVVEIDEPNVISAFLEAGYIVSPNPEEPKPVKAEARKVSRAKKTDNN